MMKNYFRKALSVAVCAAAIAELMTVVSCSYELNELKNLQPIAKTVTLTFKADGGNWSGSTDDLTLTGTEGETLTAPVTPTKIGYTFSVWNPALPTVFPTEDTTYTATYTPNIYTLTLDPNGGTAGTTKLYEKYDIGWYLDEACTNEVTASTTITKPTRSGYAFCGYYGTTNGTGPQYITAEGRKTDAVVNTIITDDTVTLYAKWSTAAVTATIVSSDITMTKTVDGNTVTLTAAEGYTYTWYVDDAVQSTTANVLTLDTSTWAKGSYDISLDAAKGGITYSAQITVTVGEN